MSSDIKELNPSEETEEYVCDIKDSNDSDFEEFIYGGIEKAREIINASKGN